MKHTEGPWTTEEIVPKRYIGIISKEDLLVATTCDVSREKRISFEEAKANALLISKAPELLKALEECVDKMQEEQHSGVKEGIYEDEPREDIYALRELIFEAKGITGVCPKCEESFANHNDDGSCVKD